MLFTAAFSAMLFSSIYIILFTNHLTTLHKKELKKAATERKLNNSFQNLKVEAIEKQELAEVY